MAKKPEPKRKRKTTRVCRPSRLKPDTRRKDPNVLVGTSPSDELVSTVPLPPFEGQVFSILTSDAQGMPRVGRPRKPIDIVMVQRLAALPGITDREMAGVCGVSYDCFSRRKKSDPAFATAVESGRAAGLNRIRQWQAWHLESGNFEAARWLGIQELGQRRTPETMPAAPEVSGKSALLDMLERMEASTLTVVPDVEDDEETPGGVETKNVTNL